MFGCPNSGAHLNLFPEEMLSSSKVLHLSLYRNRLVAMSKSMLCMFFSDNDGHNTICYDDLNGKALWTQTGSLACGGP